jgi:hypothetical protein
VAARSPPFASPLLRLLRSGQPREKLGRFHSSVTQDLSQDSATKVFTLVFGNGGGSTVLMPKKLVTALLSHLNKAE